MYLQSLYGRRIELEEMVRDEVEKEDMEEEKTRVRTSNLARTFLISKAPFSCASRATLRNLVCQIVLDA